MSELTDKPPPPPPQDLSETREWSSDEAIARNTERDAAIIPDRCAEIDYSPEDLQNVTDHLSRPGFDHFEPNDVMISRIGQAMSDGRLLTEGEQNFMTHELAEKDFMDSGMSYEEAHELALQTHPPMKNYDPDVINQFPEIFNNNWRRVWGLEP